MRRILAAAAFAVLLLPTNAALVARSFEPMACCVASGETCECPTPVGWTRCPKSDGETPAAFSRGVLVGAASSPELDQQALIEVSASPLPLSLSLPPASPPPRP